MAYTVREVLEEMLGAHEASKRVDETFKVFYPGKPHSLEALLSMKTILIRGRECPVWRRDVVAPRDKPMTVRVYYGPPGDLK